MSAVLQPIPTRYKGYHFRSRLEARWAVFFDAGGIAWEYEREGYKLKDRTYYLPDFWFPEFQMHIEVKGERPSAEYILMLELFRDQSGQAVLLLVGPPGESRPFLYAWDAHDGGGGTWEGHLAMPPAKIYPWGAPFLTLECAPRGEIYGDECYQHKFDYYLSGATALSFFRPLFEAARSARFEHGECGAT